MYLRFSFCFTVDLSVQSQFRKFLFRLSIQFPDKDEVTSDKSSKKLMHSTKLYSAVT